MENNEQLLKYDENIGLYDHINPILNLKDLNRKQVKGLAKEIANNESQTHSWQEVLNGDVNYDSKNERQEKRFKRIFNKQLNENLAPILEKQHKQELIDRMKSGDASAMSQWTTEGIDKFGHQFMPVMLTAATLPFGIGAFGQATNTIGLLPAIGAELGSWGLGYGGYKLGSKLDDDFGTNWIAPALSAASGIGGYGAGYKGMVKAGSKGWLPKGDKFMYGNQFMGDVVADAFNKSVKTTNLRLPYDKSVFDSWHPIGKYNELVAGNKPTGPIIRGSNYELIDVPEWTVKPATDVLKDHPNTSFVTGGTALFDGDQAMLMGYKDGHMVFSNPKTKVMYDFGPGYKPNQLATQRTKGSGTLSIKNGVLHPSEEGGDIWWEQDGLFYPDDISPTFVIDNVIPTESALKKHGSGTKWSRVSGPVNLSDPKLNFRFVVKDPVTGFPVESPLVLDEHLPSKGSYAFYERPSKLTLAERMGIPKGERSNPKALDNPQYWGYEQWNERYNTAVRAENWNEVQRLRNLHFKMKAPDTKIVDEKGNPLIVYHGSPNTFTAFDTDPTIKRSHTSNGSFYFTDNATIAQGYGKTTYPSFLNIKNPFIKDFKGSSWNRFVRETTTAEKDTFTKARQSSQKRIKELEKEIEKLNNELFPFSDQPFYVDDDVYQLLQKKQNELNELITTESFNETALPKHTHITTDEMLDYAKNNDYDGSVFKNIYDAPDPHLTHIKSNDFVSFYPFQIKSAHSITWDDSGNIIPIVKRDNFRSLDIRYNNGGKIENGK